MNEEKLIDAMGLIDDDIIEKAEKIRNKKRPSHVKKISLVAACVILAFVSTFTLFFIFRKDKPVSAEKEESELIPDSSFVDEENTSDSNGQNEDLPIGESEDNKIGIEALPDGYGSAYTIPLKISVTSVHENYFICRIIDTLGNEEFQAGDRLTVRIFENTVLPEGGLSEGDTVYMIFTKALSEDRYTVCAYEIYTEEGETTPALFTR